MRTILILIFCFHLVNSATSQWTNQVSGTGQSLTSIQFLNADTGFCCSEGGILLKTINGGLNWNSINPNCGGSKIHFINKDTGFVFFNYALQKTTDGGLNYSTKLSSPNVIEALSFPTQSTGFTILLSNDYDSTYVYKSNDYGENWSIIGSLPVSGVISCYFINTTIGFLGTNGGFIYRTADGGVTWNPIFASSDGGYLMDFYFPTATTGYAITDMLFLKSFDGGITWNENIPTYSPIYYAVDCPELTTCHVVGGSGLGTGTLMKTINSGNNWTQTGITSVTYHDIDFVGDTLAFACGLGGSIIKYTGLPTSIEEDINNFEFNLYPNPSNGIFTIDYTFSLTKDAIITVYDITGSVLFRSSLNLNESKKIIDISESSEGLYFYSITTASKVLKSGKFVLIK